MDFNMPSEGEDEDLRYACPRCGRTFTEPTPDWSCTSCGEMLRIAGALRLRSRREGLRKARGSWI